MCSCARLPALDQLLIALQILRNFCFWDQITKYLLSPSWSSSRAVCCLAALFVNLNFPSTQALTSLSTGDEQIRLSPDLWPGLGASDDRTGTSSFPSVTVSVRGALNSSFPWLWLEPTVRPGCDLFSSTRKIRLLLKCDEVEKASELYGNELLGFQWQSVNMWKIQEPDKEPEGFPDVKVSALSFPPGMNWAWTLQRLWAEKGGLLSCAE